MSREENDIEKLRSMDSFRKKSKTYSKDDSMKESMKWGSDTMLNVPKDDQPMTSSSDKDLPAPDYEPPPIPLSGSTLRKTLSIMNVSKMNVLEDLSPQEKMMASLMEGSEVSEDEPQPIPLSGRGLKKTLSIMNVSKMNILEDMAPRDINMTSLQELSESVSQDNEDRESPFWQHRSQVVLGKKISSMYRIGEEGGVRQATSDTTASLGASGGGGGGSNVPRDDDQSEVTMQEEEEEESDENIENETDLVVLDPDHPLMKRFQAALNAHLTKLNEKIALELRDLEESLRMTKKEREDLGVELYGIQQELAKFQMILEQKHDQVAQIKHTRLKKEQDLTNVRALYKDSQIIVNKERKKGSELQTEVENLALKLFYMENAKKDVRSDIAIMKQAAGKIESVVARAEMTKQKQDIYVDRLVEKVDKLKEEIAMYVAQIAAQSEETKSAKESLMEAYMEIETIELEKKELYHKWTSSLIGMRRRDEAHAAMQTALDQQEQHILSQIREIEGYKKSILREQEQNEKLTFILSKTEREIEWAKKHMAQVQAKHEALKVDYNMYSRMLQETEQALSRALADKNLRISEVTSLRKLIEQEYAARVKLEDEIMDRMRAQLTLEKASQYSKKLTKKTRERTKHLEQEIADSENLIASSSLETVNIRTRIERLKKILADLDFKISEQNAIITKSEVEIVKRNAVIERKQNQVDVINKKLTALINAAGGIELGPLEIQVNALNKAIETRSQEVMELQQLWLKQQTYLVKLCENREKESKQLIACKREMTIISQKKIRTENEIEREHSEISTIERNIRNMRNDIIKLNSLLHKEKNVGAELEEGNILMENAFISGLKDAELESIQLQARLDGIKEEKERLLNSLVEAERQIMLWEKKTQLARETRAAVDYEVGQGEMRAMRSEIHRMQVRYTQLMKQQEKMIQDMEKAVSRRDTIVTRGDAQSKLKKNTVTKGTFERQMGELRKKIKQTINEANACDNEIQKLRDLQQSMSEKLEEKQINCQQLQGISDTLDGDIERSLEIKQKNLSELLARQQKTKYYQQVKEGKYTMLCKTPAALELETQKQESRLQALTAIVDRLNSEFPHAQQALRKATLALAWRSGAHDDV
ncbi:hypothetical protein BsWGS_06019 [Bradybaena similaris]